MLPHILFFISLPRLQCSDAVAPVAMHPLVGLTPLPSSPPLFLTCIQLAMWHSLRSIAYRHAGDRPAGTASDCRMLQQSDDPWLDSGRPDYVQHQLRLTRIFLHMINNLATSKSELHAAFLKDTHRGARTHDHKVKGLALCRLS